MFSTPERLMVSLFSLSVFARLLVAVVVTHWAMIVAALAIDSSPDRVVGVTRIVLAVVALAIAAGLWLGGRREGAWERMALGPNGGAGWSIGVMLVGMGSDLGGLALLSEGHRDAACWAVILGTALLVMELGAVGGAIVARRISGPRS